MHIGPCGRLFGQRPWKRVSGASRLIKRPSSPSAQAYRCPDNHSRRCGDGRNHIPLPSGRDFGIKVAPERVVFWCEGRFHRRFEFVITGSASRANYRAGIYDSNKYLFDTKRYLGWRGGRAGLRRTPAKRVGG